MLPKVPEWRLDRLLYHLWKVEHEIGPLRKPRVKPGGRDCPIIRYAPLEDSRGGYFWGPIDVGALLYGRKIYGIYDTEDLDWWLHLSSAQRLQVLRWLDELLFSIK